MKILKDVNVAEEKYFDFSNKEKTIKLLKIQIEKIKNKESSCIDMKKEQFYRGQLSILREILKEM